MIRSETILQKLDQIEKEMRSRGVWDNSLNVEELRKSADKFVAELGRSPVGSMPFEHWLQAVFLPNARSAALTGNLPVSSQVSLMALREYDYHSHVPEAKELLRLLREFDGLFS